MNGAALYDMRNNSYVKAYIISGSTCEAVRKIVQSYEMNIFTNALSDDNLVIYYDKLTNEAEKSIYASLKISPYRNYLNRRPVEQDRIIYLMAVDKTEKISLVYKELVKRMGDQLKIITYPSDDYAGYSYIKIYNKNSGKQRMLDILCREYNIQKSVTVGKSDRKCENSSRNLNRITHNLKNEFEPLVFRRCDD